MACRIFLLLAAVHVCCAGSYTLILNSTTLPWSYIDTSLSDVGYPAQTLVGFTGFSTSASTVAFPSILLLWPSGLGAIPQCETVTSVQVMLTLFAEVKNLYQATVCPFNMTFSIFYVMEPFYINASRASTGVAPWQYANGNGEITYDPGTPRVTWTVPALDPWVGANSTGGINAARVYNLSVASMVQDIEDWRSGTQTLSGWVMVMTSPDPYTDLAYDDFADTGNPSCYASVLRTVISNYPRASLLVTTGPAGGSTCTPTAGPTSAPSRPPTAAPTATGAAPTATPSRPPTAAPTAGPTQSPSAVPTAGPTQPPSSAPTAGPTQTPTPGPTQSPTAGGAVPTAVPTQTPSSVPTAVPTQTPSSVPTGGPTQTPTNGGGTPSNAPTAVPTQAPSGSPSSAPSGTPTVVPTASLLDPVTFSSTLTTRCVSSVNTTTGASNQPRFGYGSIVLNVQGVGQSGGVLRTLVRPSSFAPLPCGRSAVRVTLALTYFRGDDYASLPLCTVPFNVTVHRTLAPVNVSTATWSTTPGLSSPLATFTIPANLSWPINYVNVSVPAQDYNTWASNTSAAGAWVLSAEPNSTGCFAELLVGAPPVSRVFVDADISDLSPFTCEPTAGPTVAPTSGTPSSEPTTEPTALPTMGVARVFVAQNTTVDATPPASPLTLRMNPSVDMQISIRTLTPKESALVPDEQGCPPLDYAAAMAMYDINCNVPNGLFTINMTLEATDRPYDTAGRNVYLCLNGTWRPTNRVCNDAGVSFVTNGPAGVRAWKATLCHLSTYMIAEYNNATRKCIDGHYGCKCARTSRMDTGSIVALSGAAALTVGRIAHLFVHRKFYPRLALLIKGLIGASVVAVLTGLLIAIRGWDWDPDASYSRDSTTVFVASLGAVAVFSGGIRTLADAWYRMKGYSALGEVTWKPLLSVLSYLSLGLAVAAAWVAPRSGESLALSISLTVLVSMSTIADFALRPLPVGAETSTDPKPLRMATRGIVRSVYCGLLLLMTAYATDVPCGTTFKG